ncbi:hypothetical protein KCP70_08960 [Salmonella enterica subsp. enterica]|nr:hypothetical protein KCP70_08960 [Salmonella enterica subsp. enterica]
MRGAGCAHIDSAVIDHLRAAVLNIRHVGFINVDGAVVNGYCRRYFFEVCCPLMTPVKFRCTAMVPISSSRDLSAASLFTSPVIEGAGPQAVYPPTSSAIFEVDKRPLFIDRAVFNRIRRY